MLTLDITGQNFQESDWESDDFATIECSCHSIERKHKLPHQKPAHGTMILGGDTSSSLNWCGYVALTGTAGKPNPTFRTVTDVSGSWIVPKLTSNPGCDSFSAAWIGIDGYSNSVVEQIGTEHDVIKGKPSYYAWFSLYPAPTQFIDGFPVNPGDIIEGKVSYKGQDDCGNSIFRLSLINYTQKVKFCTDQHTLPGNPAHLSSADWIVEAPALSDPRIPCLNFAFLPLANFKQISFDKCKTVINGRTGDIQNKLWTFDAITMSTSSSVIKAKPTHLNKESSCHSFAMGSSFKVKWVSPGPCPYELYCPPIVP